MNNNQNFNNELEQCIRRIQALSISRDTHRRAFLAFAHRLERVEQFLTRYGLPLAADPVVSVYLMAKRDEWRAARARGEDVPAHWFFPITGGAGTSAAGSSGNNVNARRRRSTEADDGPAAKKAKQLGSEPEE